MAWTFGTVLWSTLVFFFWFAVIWMFIAVFADIIRRDMSGWAKAGWIALIVILPFLGMLIYMIAVPRSAVGYRVPGRGHGNPDAAGEIDRAARLYDAGKITNDEYEQLKQQALSG